MSIPYDLPQIAALKIKVEKMVGTHPSTHTDFLAIVSAVEVSLKEHISESTLERLWGYSTRENKCKTVSVRTLDVLAKYCGFAGWEDFCLWLKQEQLKESELFENKSISSSSLSIGDRLKIGWQPDRICVVKYLGDSKFEVESSENTSVSPGDTFKAIQLQLGRPLYMEEFSTVDSSGKRVFGTYAVGEEHGLTTLRLLKD